MSEESVKKIKVSPYPIRVQFLLGPTPIVGQIVKLTMIGFLAEVSYPFVVGHKVDCQFTLPVLGEEFKETMVVIKSYDQYKGKNEAGAEIKRLSEFHFKSLNSKGKEILEGFLRRIGQLK